jgi:hypothetical protein
MTHAAMNLITGEVLTTNRANHLKRRVAQTSRWDRAHGFASGRWVFAHGTEWREILGAKYHAYAESLS